MTDAGRSGAAEAALGALVGLFAGVLAAALLVAIGRPALTDAAGAVLHMAAALAIAALVGAVPRWRAGARPLAATGTLACVLTFAARRWLTGLVDLTPLGWGWGEAGELAAMALPLTGAILGAAIAWDAASMFEGQAPRPPKIARLPTLASLRGASDAAR